MLDAIRRSVDCYHDNDSDNNDDDDDDDNNNNKLCCIWNNSVNDIISDISIKLHIQAPIMLIAISIHAIS